MEKLSAAETKIIGVKTRQITITAANWHRWNVPGPGSRAAIGETITVHIGQQRFRSIEEAKAWGADLGYYPSGGSIQL